MHDAMSIFLIPAPRSRLMDRDYLRNEPLCAPPGVFNVHKRGMGLPEGDILYYTPITEPCQKNIARTSSSIHHCIAPHTAMQLGLIPAAAGSPNTRPGL